MFRGILIHTGLEEKNLYDLRMDEMECQSQIDRIEIIQRSYLFMEREKIDPIELSFIMGNLRSDAKASNFVSYYDAVIAESSKDLSTVKIHLLEAYKNNTPESYVNVKAQAAFGLACIYKCHDYRHRNLARASAWLIEAIRLRLPYALSCFFADKFIPLEPYLVEGQADYRASYAHNYTMLAIMFALDMRFKEENFEKTILFKVINFSVLQSFQKANEQVDRLNHLDEQDSGLKQILLMAAHENPYVCFDLLKTCLSMNLISQTIFTSLSELLVSYIWEADLCDEINQVLLEIHLNSQAWDKAKSCLNELTLVPNNFQLKEFLKIENEKIRNEFCLVLLGKYWIMRENDLGLSCLLNLNEISVEHEDSVKSFIDSINIQNLKFTEFKKFWQIINKFKSMSQNDESKMSANFKPWLTEKCEKFGTPKVLVNKSILFIIKLLRECIKLEGERSEFFYIDNGIELKNLNEKLIHFEEIINSDEEYKVEEIFVDFVLMINTSKRKLPGEFIKVFGWGCQILEKTAVELNLQFDVDGLLPNMTALSVHSVQMGFYSSSYESQKTEIEQEMTPYAGISLRQV